MSSSSSKESSSHPPRDTIVSSNDHQQQQQQQQLQQSSSDAYSMESSHNSSLEPQQQQHQMESSSSSLPEDNDPIPTNMEEITPHTKNIIFELMKQVKIGMDLTKVMLPVDFLEPQSLLERITVYCRMIYLLDTELMRRRKRAPDANDDDDDDKNNNGMNKQQQRRDAGGNDETQRNLQRMASVLRWYISGWHIRPAGVKKPYNPILGEFHRCRFPMGGGTASDASNKNSNSSNNNNNSSTTHSGADSTTPSSNTNNDQAFLWLAEQVSHHPPISAFYGETTRGNIQAEGWYYPKSKFLGLSAASEIQGELRLTFTELQQTYIITWPTVYARGIIFGKLVMEIGGDCTIRCEETGVSAQVKFHSKPFIGGEYNCVSGKIQHNSKKVATFKGKWDSKVTIKWKKHQPTLDDNLNPLPNPQKNPTQLMDCSQFTPLKKNIPKSNHIKSNESVRVWHQLTKAVRRKDLTAAQDAKYEVEEAQREKMRARESKGEEWKPRFFRKESNGVWRFIGKDSSEYQLLKEKQNLDGRPL